MWYALLIPAILTLLSYLKWGRSFTPWEILIPTAAGALTILITQYVIEYRNIHDIEYNGYVVKEARYYEYWDSWEERTCSYTTCNGTDSKGNCTGYTTHYYDCSYCDRNAAYWQAVDNYGHTYSITEAKYKSLIRQWKSSPGFVELNRSIVQHGSCGNDGDMYRIEWDGDILTSEAAVQEHSFKNKLKLNHSAFSFPVISDEKAKEQGLFSYPEFYDVYKQPAILGLEKFNISDKSLIQRQFEYLNGDMGPGSKVKVFTLLFKNKPIDIAFKQEAYWGGGNQNEIVTCIGMDDVGNMVWVKAFSWCDNKRILVDIREDISNLEVFNAEAIYNIYRKNIPLYFKYKSFKDFNYLKFEATASQIGWVYIITTLISVLSIWFCVKNNLDN